MKKVISLFLCLCLLLCGCGSASVETVPETTTEPLMSFDEYIALVSEVVETIYADCGLLASIVRYQDSYWTALENMSGTVTQDNLISRASEWLEDESDGEYSFDKLTSSYDSISIKYKEIAFAEVDSSVDKIEEVFDEYYNAYLCLYNVAMTPSGSHQEFVNTANSYIGSISSTKSKIDILISE